MISEEGEAKMPTAADMYDDEHMRSFFFFFFFFLYGKDFGQTPMSCFFLCNGKGKGLWTKLIRSSFSFASSSSSFFNGQGDFGSNDVGMFGYLAFGWEGEPEE
jgi:hypothetical protein